MLRNARFAVAAGLLVTLLAAGCTNASQPPASPEARVESPSPPGPEAGAQAGATAAPAPGVPQQPLAVEQSPPGDIPDNQAFVPYRSTAGFQVSVPEGWARTESGDTASFTDKLNVVSMTWAKAATAPTVASVRAQDAPNLQSRLPAFELEAVKQVKLPAGEAVLLTYRQNGEPNAVTGKAYRLDASRFVFFRNGTRVDLVLTSPAGADNVDPWRTISESFRWR